MPIKWKPYIILDDGKVEVDEISGSDSDIIRRARISTTKGAKNLSTDEKLIRYLITNNHSSPFGFPSLTLFIRCPLFIKNQWIRHRTGWLQEIEVVSTDNDAAQFHEQQEFSGRYAIYDPKFYLPPISMITKPSTKQHQGRTEEEVEDAAYERQLIYEEQQNIRDAYLGRIGRGMSREIARINMPLSTYTEFYWKQNLWNMLHWLGLRRENGSQWEIREYAAAVEDIIRVAFPLTYKAWLEVQEGTVLLAKDLEELLPLLEGATISKELARKLRLVD